MPSFLQIKDWFLQTLYKRIILILIILFVAGIAIAVTSMNSLSSRLIESQALQSAKIHAHTIQKARSLYNAEVVARAQKVPGIEVTHDYPNIRGGIPLPATYLIQLSNLVSEQNTESSIRFYSSYPFPWRKTEGGARDEFEQEALQYLTKHPQKTFYRIENYNNRPTLRYAKPDIMRPSCVACHNSHPDSPKKDWRVGQVRGVLEINQPLDEIILQSRSGLSQTSLKLSSIAILAMFGLALVIGRLKFINKELDILVKKRTAQLNQANTDLEQVRQEVSQLRIQVDQEKREKEVNEIVDSHNFDAIAKLGQKWRLDYES